MRIRNAILLPICLILLAWTITGYSQNQPDAGQPAAEKQARKQFDDVMSRWKKLLSELRDLRTDFQVAEEDQLEKIRDEFNSKIVAGEEMVTELQDSSVAAYEETPNADRELSRFIIKLAADEIRKDEYAMALQLLEPMAENKSDERELPDLMGIASFGTNDFETAEKYLTEAKKKEALSEQGQKCFEGLVQAKEGWEKELEFREQESNADDLPRVKLETTSGDITIELFENEAPETVGNFISLVEKGFYDGLTFHRVLQGFMAQGGCPNGDGSGGPGYRIYCESVNDNHRHHFAGSLSMAKEVPRHTGGSQFFINFVATPYLDGQHTVFGRVIEGMDLLPKIVKQDPEARKAQPTPTKIVKATVLRKRDHEYLPNKVK